MVLDEAAAAELDRQSGTLKSGRLEPHHCRGQPRFQNTYGDCNGSGRLTDRSFGGDSGGASRFFYTAKASRAERNAGLDAFAEKPAGKLEDDAYEWATDGKGNPRTAKTTARNSHPTVLEGFDFLGLEREPEYVEIARARIAHWAERRPVDQLSMEVV